MANTRHFEVVSAGKANFGPSSVLNATPDRSLTVPRSVRIQPFSETTTVIGSRSTSASSIAASSCTGACAKAVRRLPSGVLGPNFARTSLTSSGDPFPLLRLGTDEILELLALGAQRLVLLPDLHFLELAQIAQPHVEDGVGLHVGELERLHQHGLGLVLAADDLDHLVEVEIGDEIAAEHFEPMLDLAEAEIRRAAAAPRGGG